MPQNDFTHELQIAKDIAYKAGKVMRQYFDGDQQRAIKDDGTPVTIADKLINSMVIKELAEYSPDDIVIGEEESTGDYGLGRRWFCDPIDGTKAYTWGVPTAMFSLGLVIDGNAHLGVTYDPFLDKLYWAIRGSGAFCNNAQIHVNDKTLASGILGIIGSHYRIRNEAPYLDELHRRHVDMAVFSGAVSKCVRIAEGRFVGYIEELVNAHDMAASQVIIEEAGGTVTAPDGSKIDYSKPFKGAIASNGIVHDELVALVQGNS